MPSKLHSVIAQDLTITASQRVTIDLPVNPITTILLTLRARDTGAVTAARGSLAAFLAQLATLRVVFKGTDIINATPLDAFVTAAFLRGALPKHNTMEDTATAVRFCTIPLMFSRKHYWPEEGFPASRRGELQLIIDVGASLAGFDQNSLQIETCEMLDAQPGRFIKYTTLARTWPATGQNDVDLPLGNPLLGCTLFGTSFPTGGSFNATFGQVSVLVDNVNFTYALTNWETLQNEIPARLSSAFEPWTHTHAENLAAAYAQSAETDVPSQARDAFRQYAYLDWDPLMDGQYMLQTEGRGSVRVRAFADVADAARLIPIELVQLQPAEIGRAHV